MGYDLNKHPVLLTGARGYLGQHIINDLKKLMIPYVGVSSSSCNISNMEFCDLTKEEEVIKLIGKVSPCCIIHCAASVPKKYSDYDDRAAADASLVMVENITKASSCPVVFISSMTVYSEGACSDKLVKEEDAGGIVGVGYASAKLQAEKVIEKYCNHGAVVLRMPGLFGSTRKNGLLYNCTKSFLQGEHIDIAQPYPMWAAIDVRDAAKILKGKKIAKHVSAMVVPGSGLVKQQAEEEGLDKLFKAAGFDWREPGCSMCLAMNADKLNPKERCASTSNRNFEGRQGRGGRTHLLSPAMAAAAAIDGHLTDVRKFQG